MEKYITGQRKVLLDFLCSHCDRQFTIEEITKALCGDNTISKSAIYRNIDKLVREGSVQKSAAEGSRKFCYRYVEDTGCSDHLHMKCVICGRLYHLDSEATQTILKLAQMNGSFRVNEKKTVLYGMCGNCG